MDERLREPIDSTSGPGARPHREKRQQFRQLLTLQREQLDTLEQSLERQVGRISEELAAAHAAREAAEASPAVDDSNFESQRLALAQEAENLARLATETDRRQAELAEFENRLKIQEQTVVDQLARQQAELDERAAQVDVAAAQLRQSQRTLSLDEEELVADRQRVAHARERLEEQLHSVEHQRDELAAAKSELNNQRRRIAKEFQHQRATQKAEIAKEREQLAIERESLRQEQERRREELQSLAEGNQTELAGRLEETERENRQLKSQRDAIERQLDEQTEAFATKRAEHTQAMEDLAILGIEHQQLSKLLSEQPTDQVDSGPEIAELRRQIASLRAQLTESESRPQQGETEADVRKREDMKRRFELAVDDIRDLKRRNAELEEKLANASESSALGLPIGDGKLDWEAQKRRLLASLQADDDGDDDRHGDTERGQDRLTIEGTIRITDEIVARKDREIHELKRVLEDQSSNLGNVAVGAAAIAEMLDKDELVQQERVNLTRLQTEWREKLRQAEIDISLERARMARERLEIEDKLQELTDERGKRGNDPNGRGEPAKPVDKSWWTRLGLKEHP